MVRENFFDPLALTHGIGLWTSPFMVPFSQKTGLELGNPLTPLPRKALLVFGTMLKRNGLLILSCSKAILNLYLGLCKEPGTPTKRRFSTTFCPGLEPPSHSRVGTTPSFLVDFAGNRSLLDNTAQVLSFLPGGLSKWKWLAYPLACRQPRQLYIESSSPELQLKLSALPELAEQSPSRKEHPGSYTSSDLPQK